MYTRQVKNLKSRLGKKGYPGGLETWTGDQGKSLGLKCTTMSRWIIYIQQALLPTSSSIGTDQFSQLFSNSERWDARGHRGNSRVETRRDYLHIAICFVFTVYSFYFMIISSY